MFHFRVTQLLFIVTISLILTGDVECQHRSGGFKLEPYVFETFDKQKVDAELGRLAVPENRKNPKSNLIELAFVRFRSVSKNPGPPIVYLAGGPGASGIASARGRRFPLFMAMREFGDVIALDQRATGLSKPSLNCRPALNYPLDKPGDAEELRRLYKLRSQECAQELTNQGVDLAGYTINESTVFVGNNELADLPALYYAISKGDSSSPDVLRWAQWAHGVRRGAAGSAMQIMIDCASGVSRERYARINREIKETLLGNLTDFPFPQICEAWGSPDLGAAFRTPVRSKTPVLLISGTLDGRTPVSNAEEVQKGFPNSTHLIIEGAVHGDSLFLSSPKIKDAMMDFMRDKPIQVTKIALPPFKFSPLRP